MQSINKVSAPNDSSLSLLLNCTVKSFQLSQMDCAQLKSIVSLVDSLVRNTQVRKSRVLSSNQVPVGEASLAPVSSTSLTDFSICSILGLERDITQSPPISGKFKVSSLDTLALNRRYYLAFLIIAMTITKSIFIYKSPFYHLDPSWKKKKRNTQLYTGYFCC